MVRLKTPADVRSRKTLYRKSLDMFLEILGNYLNALSMGLAWSGSYFIILYQGYTRNKQG